MAAALRKAGSDRCEVCWQGCRRAERIECRKCGGVAHVRCAFPSLGVTRTAMFSDFVCDGCVEFDFGILDAEGYGQLAGLARLATQLEAEALAKNSHGTYASGIASFEKFCRGALHEDPDFIWDALRLDGRAGAGRAEAERARSQFWRTLQLYVAWAVDGKARGLPHGLTVGSVTTYLAGGVATRLRELGFRPEEGTAHWRLKRVLQGWRRRLGDAGEGEPRQAEAMDEELLRCCIEELLAGRVPNVRGDGVMSVFEREQAAVVLLLEFAGIARRSEAKAWQAEA